MAYATLKQIYPFRYCLPWFYMLYDVGVLDSMLYIQSGSSSLVTSSSGSHWTWLVGHLISNDWQNDIQVLLNNHPPIAIPNKEMESFVIEPITNRYIIIRYIYIANEGEMGFRNDKDRTNTLWNIIDYYFNIWFFKKNKQHVMTRRYMILIDRGIYG